MTGESRERQRTLTPEQKARVEIDRMLDLAGWVVQDARDINPTAAQGVAVREFVLPVPAGRVDYLLFVDGQPVGVIEAKPVGIPLTGVEWQSARYAKAIPEPFKPSFTPLPFVYEATGAETAFTNTLDPEPTSRLVYWFHQPRTLAEWLRFAEINPDAPTVRARLQVMPPVDAADLWRPKDEAVRNLEKSLRENRPRALIQMSTGAGKTKLAAFQTYRLVKHAGAKRVLFLVDRANLGRQAEGEFQSYETPDTGKKFTELYTVQRLTSNVIDPVARVCITTIQRLYSILSGEPELPPERDEESPWDADVMPAGGVTVNYNPFVPIESFDFIIVDECHRSIFGLWRQVLDYFDAFIVGLTATPNKAAFGFFNRNLVIEYPYEQAVADRVNVDFDVFRIRTKMTEQGGEIESGEEVGYRSRESRKTRWAYAEDELTYDATDLDREIVAPDQIRTVIATFRDHLPMMFPDRHREDNGLLKHIPKTLIFAKDDAHADDIVRAVREEFGKGNDFCRKITYKATGNTEDLIKSFRIDYPLRIAVTVDMIATGTDIKPLECLLFMRTVRSRTFFEQMRGRGVRVISPTDLRAVTPDAVTKDRFVLVDAVGVTDAALVDNPPLERKNSVPFPQLVQMIVDGNRDADVISSLASRLARLDDRISKADREELRAIAGDRDLGDLSLALVDAIDPDLQRAAAQRATKKEEPSEAEIVEAAAKLIDQAVRPIVEGEPLRAKLVAVRTSYEQAIDVGAEDVVLAAEFTRDSARELVQSFKDFIEEHKDEIVALEVLYSRGYGKPPTFEQVKELASAIARPPRAWTAARLWAAYERVDKSKVRGSGRRALTDLVSLVRFTLEHDGELVPYAEQVTERYVAWLTAQEQAGTRFTPEQKAWLDGIKDVVAASMNVSKEDFDYAPLIERGGLGGAYAVFGDQLDRVLEELNEALAA